MARTRKATPGDPSIGVAYLRVSTDHQDLGPEAQRATINAWAKANDVTVTSWHFDKGVSGSADLGDRPELIAALANVKTHGAGTLLVANRDRLARDSLIAQLVERAAKQVGAVVVSANGVANGDDAASKMLRTILDAVSAYERDMIRGRIRAALAVKKRKGERVGSVPFGFRPAEDGRHLVPVADEQATIEKAKALRGGGATYRAVATELGHQGYLSRTGRVFDPQQVRRMLLAA